MENYIATFKTGEQISPDDWAVINPSLKINENTTIGEINEWFKKKNGGKVMQVSIIELEEIED